MLLSGKTAIVTGASQGLGKAYAVGLAKAGANVVVNDIKDDVNLVVEEIKKAGYSAAPCVADISTMKGGESTVKTAAEQFGGVDILVNNAGINRDKTFLKMTEEEWDLVMAVNLKSVFNTCKFAVPVMKEQQSGSIINITSAAAFIGNIGQSNYAAAKAGMIGFTLSLSLELARYNIRVNNVWPRAITPMTQPVLDKMIERSKSSADAEATPLDVGLGSADMVAPLIVYLASDDSKDITGKILGLRGETLNVWSHHKEIATATMIGGWTVEEIKKRIGPTLGWALK
jgi:NAD(P)-dependent dehydrogenase (short-subunit alcohol dehydrogenase family)